MEGGIIIDRRVINLSRYNRPTVMAHLTAADPTMV
jgi:hypothetical protein